MRITNTVLPDGQPPAVVFTVLFAAIKANGQKNGDWCRPIHQNGEEESRRIPLFLLLLKSANQ